MINFGGAIMAMGRPKMELVLSDSEREQQLVWSRRGRTSQSLAMRVRGQLLAFGLTQHQFTFRSSAHLRPFVLNITR